MREKKMHGRKDTSKENGRNKNGTSGKITKNITTKRNIRH